MRSYPGDWDSADLYAKLPAQNAAVIDTVVTAAARRMLADAADGDTLTMDQARADALIAPFLLALATGVLDGPTPIQLMPPPGGRLELVVRASTATLAGDADEPGELDGHGPISADLARDLASQDQIPVRVLVTDRGARAAGRHRRLPARPAAGRVHPGPGPHLRRPRLLTRGRALRPRPHRGLAAGPDQPHQPRTAVPAQPPDEAAPRLQPRTARTRTVPLAIPHRPHLRHQPRDIDPDDDHPAHGPPDG